MTIRQLNSFTNKQTASNQTNEYLKKIFVMNFQIF